MTEEENRYKIKKIESYNREKKDYSKKAAKAFGVGAAALATIVVGWGGLTEYLSLVPNAEMSYLLGTTSSLIVGGSVVEIVQIKRIIESIRNKIKLDGRIEEINEELDMLDEENDISRGGR